MLGGLAVGVGVAEDCKDGSDEVCDVIDSSSVVADIIALMPVVEVGDGMLVTPVLSARPGHEEYIGRHGS